MNTTRENQSTAAGRMALMYMVILLTMIATAVSELGTNIIRYAREGRVTLRIVSRGHRAGIEVLAEDKGPGIRDLDEAMKDHASTGKGLGLGLPSVRRIMDEFFIESRPGAGTREIGRAHV